VFYIALTGLLDVVGSYAGLFDGRSAIVPLRCDALLAGEIMRIDADDTTRAGDGVESGARDGCAVARDSTNSTYARAKAAVTSVKRGGFTGHARAPRAA